jgi:tetratricopeptide (TPR) repeat protein
MRRGAFLSVLALLTAGCASAHGGAPATRQTPGVPALPADEKNAAMAGNVAPPTDTPEVRFGVPRAKTLASGAEYAERWLPDLGAALARQSASPTVEHEVGLAHAYRDAGILDQAYDHYEAAAHLDPHESAAWDGLARIWRDWGYPQLGLGDAYRAVWADQRSAVARNTLGTILQLLGRHQDASEQFARAVTLDPRAAYAHYNLAVACATLGRFADAADAFERAAVLDPSLDLARVRAMEVRQQVRDAVTGKGENHERR